jgi:exonuclease VII small subunit
LFVSDQTGLYNPGMDKLASIVQQLQQERARIDAALRALTGATNQTGATRTGRRTLSAAARQRIAAAQRKRWAKFKAAKAGKPKG